MSTHGPWRLECDLADGARITTLQYDGTDLLTAAPAAFHPPRTDYGRYETRPVYGYDDCFPTVEACLGWPDHGELCWLPWQGTPADCSVRSRRWPVVFRRRLEFAARTLTWSFSLTNEGGHPLPFQHAMHPLMPLDRIASLELPSADAARQLRAAPRGTARMLYINDVPEGRFAVAFLDGPRLEVTFPKTLFPTLSIWWNNRGYPDEDGLRRCECAFEPTPGRNTHLEEGTTLTSQPHGTMSWAVTWNMTS